MAAFANLDDVAARLDFELDTAEQEAVTSALDDLSDEARYYAGEARWDDVAAAPNLVKVIIAKAVARWARNMNGFVQSKAGDETVSWAKAESEAGSASLSYREIKLLKSLGSSRPTTGAFGTISIVARSPRVDVDTYISIAGSGQGIPFVDPSGW